MRKFQCLLFVLKRPYAWYYIVCLTVPLILFYEKKASTFYQNHPLALHTVEVFCNLIWRNHWFSTWKVSDGLIGIELTLRYIEVELEKYFNYLTRLGLVLWYIGVTLLKYSEYPWKYNTEGVTTPQY